MAEKSRRGPFIDFANVLLWPLIVITKRNGENGLPCLKSLELLKKSLGLVSGSIK